MLVISLYAILSHLDWSCRTNKQALVKNMEVIAPNSRISNSMRRRLRGHLTCGQQPTRSR